MQFKIFFIFIIISQLQFPQNTFWEKIDAALKSDVSTFGFNSKNEIFIGTSGQGIYKSSDNGNTWKNIKGKLTAGRIDCILFTKEDNMFTGVSCIKSYVTDEHPYGIYLLENDLSEPKISFSTLYVWSMVIDSLGNLFASTDNMYDYPDVVKLINGQSKWIAIENGIPIDFLTKIIIDINGNLYITRYEGGLYQSKDKGNNWTLIENEFNNVRISDITTDSKGNLIVVFENNGIYKSFDEGKTWSKLNLEINCKEYCVVRGLCFNQQDDLFVNIFPKGIFRSKDGGESWETVGNELLNRSITTFGIDNNGFLWVGKTNRGLYRSIQTTLLKQ